MGENLKNLLKVKTIVTFVVTVVWAYLAITQVLDAEDIQNVFFIVMSFFFGAQYGKRDSN